jgi:hypothetical protein
MTGMTASALVPTLAASAAEKSNSWAVLERE